MHSSVDMPGHRQKPLGRWTGPHQIIGVTNSHVYTIKHLVTEKVQEVHAVRMKFYSDASLNVTQELKEHDGQQGLMMDVKDFIGHKKGAKKGEWLMLVHWAGFEQLEATWEPLSTMAEDVPVLVAQKKTALGTTGKSFTIDVKKAIAKAKGCGKERAMKMLG